MWQPLERIIKKASTTASVVVTENVKTEAKKLGKDILPTVLSIGAVIAGVIIFRNTSAGKAITGALEPTVSHVTITTNNYFFDSNAKAELLSKIME